MKTKLDHLGMEGQQFLFDRFDPSPVHMFLEPLQGELRPLGKFNEPIVGIEHLFGDLRRGNISEGYLELG
jgi:hypothetical protein